MSVTVDPKLLEMLVCPDCHGAVLLVEDEGGGLQCEACGRIYPVRDGIPVMLIDQASDPTRKKSGC